jgi:hypothetical protein
MTNLTRSSEIWFALAYSRIAATSLALGVIATCLDFRSAKTSVEIPAPVSRVLLCSETHS